MGSRTTAISVSRHSRMSMATSVVANTMPLEMTWPSVPVMARCAPMTSLFIWLMSDPVWTRVKNAMGTDSGVTPHGRNLTELREMVSLGMGEQAVWESSTRVAAELMGIDASTGTLRPGMVADIAVWNGTDLDVATLRDRVDTVIQDGVLVA